MRRVALVGPELEENLSLRYLASSLSVAGFEPDIVPFDVSSDFPRVLAQLLDPAAPPLLIGLSLSFQRRAKDFLALAVGLHRKGYPGHITAGGHFGTFAGREILRDFPEIDSICLHESEETIVALVHAVSSGNDPGRIPGLLCRDAGGNIIATNRHPPPDLDGLPWPDRRGIPSQCLGHRMAPLVGSRGCYANCAFCCISAWHEQTLPGKRFRLRPVDDIVAEMAWLAREKKTEVFVFHDDNFFLPDRAQTLRRIHELGSGLERRGVHGFATIVKARPNDLDREIVEAMQERLGLLRLYLGVESDSYLGLVTLGRRVMSDQNHRALELLEETGVYACFNMLIFDPSTRMEDLETNLRFMEKFAEVPQNFGRVELYAGTPLLARMQADGRCIGDYLEWDYRMESSLVQQVFELTMACFFVRNFSDESVPHRLMGTRFCVEVAARFHPEAFLDSTRKRVKRLNRILTQDSVQAVREIIEFVKSNRSKREAIGFMRTLIDKLRAAEQNVREAAGVLEEEIQDTIRMTRSTSTRNIEQGENQNEEATRSRSYA